MNLSKIIKERFHGKKVLLMGLGLQGGGEGIARFFLWAGAELIAADLRPKREFKEILNKFSKKKIKFVFGRHHRKHFKWADIIIKNPAVPSDSPFLKYANKIGKPVFSETQIFFDLVPRQKIIGVTGTKGKTTTAMLLSHILEAQFTISLIGNIPGHSPLESLIFIKKLPDFFVYELSSFNLEGLTKSPKYAIITNIFPDHLNRYKNFTEYKNTKANIFKYQKRGDFLLRASKQSEIFKKEQSSNLKICLISPEVLQLASKTAYFLGIGKKKTTQRLESFKPAKGRLEYLGKIKYIHVINDTASTNPESADFSIQQIKKCFNLKPSQIVLIMGGENKKLKYIKFSQKIKDLKQVIVIPGSASEQIKGSNILKVYSLNFAVKKAFDTAEEGDCIMFSPASASFNMFKNEFERGEAFKKAVKGLL